MAEVSITSPGERINDPSEKPVRTRSTFPSLSYRFYNTERFGEYNCNFVMDCVEGDKVPLQSISPVQSLSLKAPLMQSISKKKDYYLVPMEAILRLNWKKFYENPTIGDDVPDNVGTGVENFWVKVSTTADLIFNGIYSVLNDANSTEKDCFNAMVRGLVFLEMFYSNGSLMHSLGCNGSAHAYLINSVSGNSISQSVDAFFDQIMTLIKSQLSYFEFVYDNTTYWCIIDFTKYGYLLNQRRTVTFHDFLQLVRDDLSTYVSNPILITGGSLKTTCKPYFDTNNVSKHFGANAVNYDLRRLWAYQICCAHFYSNDHVDYIYSADLFHQLVDFYTRTHSDGSFSPLTFTLNGIKLEYDSTSAYVFDEMIGNRVNNNISDFLLITNESTTTATWIRCLRGYFCCLFSYRRSLRFVDYFTGSRTRPLAVGDVNVNVNANLVNIVDVTRNIQRQRFFNAVNRFGRKFEEYIKGLSGITPAPDYHNPMYLAHTQDTIFGQEVENTGAAQISTAQSVTSRLRSNDSRYQFHFECDRPCVVLGITYYDIPRAYLFSCERQLMHLNRFDMFNPYMQFIGDQDIKYAELGSEKASAGATTFGYTLRHMEYKQRYDQAAGGFVENLPGFLFTDRTTNRLSVGYQTPDFIRSLNGELDGFYVALTGNSLGSYFHFIVENINHCEASRPMAFAPSIL